jgi:hypothetical protein
MHIVAGWGMMISAAIPHEPCNSLIRANRFAPLMKKILDQLKPEAPYFTEMDATRGVVLILADPSMVPVMAEPLLLNFNAHCRLRICLSTADLSQAGLDEVVKHWG